MPSPGVQRTRAMFSNAVQVMMGVSAIVSLLTVGGFPLVKARMLNYTIPDVGCVEGKCDNSSHCVINGTVLGTDFKNVENYYTMSISSLALFVNFLLATRIVGARFINMFFTTFAFFCLIVFPVRFIFLAMQTLEFTAVGGDYYTLLLLTPDQFNCPFFSSAVVLMHLRFILLVLDFITFHALIVSVPLFYVDDKLNFDKYHAVHDEKPDIFQGAAPAVMFQDV
ncbi:hypothetical protein CRE_00070 [Caenorhabditis remanei]|uniref:Uncharacterized protein n=1 Tax=Caenorhabditis remanei TaxID=31234 RepID=E3LCX0_CAERE|nr:hypothetical protein CRE_00070 [Caenorhabditis remanei]